MTELMSYFLDGNSYLLPQLRDELYYFLYLLIINGRTKTRIYFSTSNSKIFSLEGDSQ